jgi:ribosomal protein S18 acetylase RimI-like enzyme
MNYKLLELSKRDIDKIYQLQPEGWHDIVYYFSYYVKAENCFPICIKRNGNIMAVGNAIINGNTGWVAHIIVGKAYRRQGFGYQITQKLVKILKSKGCQTILLIATDEGTPLYRKLGFEFECNYCSFQGLKMHFKPSGSIKELDLNKYAKKIFKLDKRITNEDRCKFVLPLTNEAYAYFDDLKEIRGFFLPSLSEGPIIALNRDFGLELLKFKHSIKACRSVVPDSNQHAIRFFEENGFIEVNRMSRMYLGKKLEWHPEAVFSRIGGFIG